MINPTKHMKTSSDPGRKIISHAANQSVRPYSSNQEYLYAMREDLADWLKGLYAVDINVTNFFDVLETGTLLCQHANNITTCANYIKSTTSNHQNLLFPQRVLVYNQGRYVRASSFFARDNIASFIGWCRSDLHIPESVMFETNDLVLRVNEKNVILCLLEVARKGSKFGVPAPVLIQMEQDIDNEIELDKRSKQKNGNSTPKQPVKQKVSCDFKSLDEMVQFILGMCTCPSQFPMIKVSDGKYKVGDSENLIFMRILRQHVMVRVGGGWDTLEHYLDKHDPCRCQRHRGDKNLSPRHSRTSSLSNQVSQSQSESTPRKPRKNQLPEQHKANRQHSPHKKDTNRLSGSGRITPRIEGERYSTTRNTAQENVFNRLSRPKSTPPIPSKSLVQQDDMLVVQRNKTGAHQVHRPSTNKNSGSMRPRNYESGSLLRTQPVPSNNLQRNRFSTSAVEPSISTARSHNPKLRHTVAAPTSQKTNWRRTQSKSQLDRPPATGGGHMKPNVDHTSYETNFLNLLDKREKEILLEFEKECIRNQAAVSSNVPSSFNESQQAERIPEPDMNSEDSEVALHMQGFEVNQPSDEMFNQTQTLPKPRKDNRKEKQHDRRTRIPTPVSFTRALLPKSMESTKQHEGTNPSRYSTSIALSSDEIKNVKTNERIASSNIQTHKAVSANNFPFHDSKSSYKKRDNFFPPSAFNFCSRSNHDLLESSQNLSVSKTQSLRGPQWV
uniref:GAS2-like protein 1 n=1 Tax=Phallusia mammillata TaxID=59560 RepID=A0A6F9DCT0_9ASCI|nr:GAS2-like protein 1 [Phallusia mammillata]